MLLRRLARGRWQVLLVATDTGKSQVLDFLLDGAAGRGEQIDIEAAGDVEVDEDATTYEAACTELLALIREHVPANGPPRSMPLSKPLGGGLYEFRKQPKGKKPRVAWFDGGPQTIVCTRGFSKRSKAETDPRDAINDSRKLMKQYKEDQKKGLIKIVDIPRRR